MLIGRLFHVRYTLRGTSYLLHRIGFTRRSPRTALPNATRPRSPPGGGDLGRASRLAAATGVNLCFEDEAGQTLRPHPRDRGVREN